MIAAGEQWTAREPERAEAWFYLGAAYGVRVQYHGQRLEFLAAARDGKRIKNSLEKALALDPGLDDANVGLGLYRYYADIAPSILKLLRWFLGLPGGDRAEGLAQMRRAREHGVLLKAEAAYQLHLVDLWYENRSGEALEILEELRARYPHNPIFLLNTAQVHEVYRSDRAGRARRLPVARRRGARRLASRAGAGGDVGTPRRGGAARSRWPNPTAPSTNCTR